MKLNKGHLKIVVKVGSAVLTNSNGNIRKKIIQQIADDIAIVNKNRQLILVSSGAISMGRKHLDLNKKISISESQALAAVGQIELMNAWKSAFKKHNINIAQILLTPKELQTRKDANNALKTIHTLHSHNTIPIVNENDTTATDEIQFGDNDLLAAKLAKLFKADLLILLSIVDGLFESFAKNNHTDKSILIKKITAINSKINQMAGEASKLGKGGMISKIEAAKIILKMGSELVITRGDIKHPISKLKHHSRSTWFSKK